MKLGCLGDIQLGAGIEGLAPAQRLADQAKVLHDAASLFIAERVDGVLFAGDAFERRSPSMSELMVWRAFVEMLGDEGIGILAIAGNHDVASMELPSGMEVVNGPSYYDPMRRASVSYAFDGLAVACLPWAPAGYWIAQRNGGNRDVAHHELAEVLVEVARGLKAEAESWPGRASLLLLHWPMTGASLPTGLPTDELREPVLPLGELEGIGFDLIVAGHIHPPAFALPGDHVFQTILYSQGGPASSHRASALYVGSPLPQDFGETHTAHGVWIIDNESGRFVSRFRPIPSRRLVNLKPDPDDLDEDWQPPDGLEDAAVKLHYFVTREQHARIDHAAVKQAIYAAGAVVVKGGPQVVQESRARVAELTDALAPLDAFELWLAAENIPVGERPVLRGMAARYLEDVAA